MTIFIGNLDRNVQEEALNNLFHTYGEIKQIKIIKDNYTGESKGFAFVDMQEEADASQAINALNETEFAGRKISVSKARPRTEGNRSGNSSYGNSNNFKKRY